MPIIPVKIKEIKQATPTIKTLKLDLQGQEFSFHSGQWIDCYADIDGERKVAGYSMTSSATQKGYFELAIKTGDNPVTEYIHSSAKEGDTLYVDGGQGEIFYTRKMGDNVVLIAAGIGIAPMMSIFRYAATVDSINMTLVYGVSSENELLYINEIKEISEKSPIIRYYATVSKGKQNSGYRIGKIDRQMLKEIDLDLDSLFYLCGPPPMIHSVETELIEMGVSKDKILYELWW
ncbi:MAG: FAD-dependent oxidoreductase [Candidatus Bathyarchaeota archaeon]|nr:FAD-dependent oxidoreductase [Candidatus Bathyarchaeota archaeon]